MVAAFGRAPHDGFEPQAAEETEGARRKAKGFMKTRVLNRRGAHRELRSRTLFSLALRSPRSPVQRNPMGLLGEAG